MADTTILQLNKLTSGSHSGTWGDLTNDNMSKIDVSIKGYVAVAVAGATQTLTTGSAGTGNQINNASIKLTGSLGANSDVVCPAQSTWYFVDDATTHGAYSLTFKPSGGTGVALTEGAKHILYTDGSTMFDVASDLGVLGASGNVTFNGGTLTFNSSGADTDAQFYGDNDNNTLYLDASTDRVGVGVAAPAAKMEIDQNSGTGAIPCLNLDQGDADQAFIDHVGTSAADSSASISSSTATAGSKNGALRIEVNGVTHWLRTYDSAI